MRERRNRVVVFGGCGAQGQETVKRLAASGCFAQIVIADRDAAKGSQLASQVGQNRATFQQVDVSDHRAVVELMGTARVVINEVGPYRQYGTMMVRAAIEAGVDYVDINDDVRAMGELLDSEEYSKTAAAKNLRIIIGLGSSPGITNLLAKHAALQMDQADEISIRSAPAGSSSPAVLASLFEWFTGEVSVFRDGTWVKVPAFTEPELVHFPFLPERRECYLAGFPEPLMLPRALRGLKEVTMKMGYPPPFMRLLQDLIRWGFHSAEPVLVDGKPVTPRDFILSYLASEEGAKLLAFSPVVPMSSAKIAVRGSKGGRRLCLTYYQRRKGGGSKVAGMPPQIAAEMLSRGEIQQTGLLTPETLDPEPFLREFTKLDVSFQTVREEICDGIELT